MTEKTLQSIFLPRAQGVGHLMRDRVWRMTAFASNEPLTVELLDGPAPMIRYRRVSDGDACIEIGAITPGPLAAVHWGEEQVLRSEQIGSTQQTIDNRDGPAPVSVKFADVFAETHSSSSSSKTGVSASITVKSTQKIGGVVGFEESITLAANREVSESEGSSSTPLRNRRRGYDGPSRQARPHHGDQDPQRRGYPGHGPGHVHPHARDRKALWRRLEGQAGRGPRILVVVGRFRAVRGRPSSRQLGLRHFAARASALARRSVGPQPNRRGCGLRCKLGGPGGANLHGGGVLMIAHTNHVRRGELEQHYATKADLADLKSEMVRWMVALLLPATAIHVSVTFLAVWIVRG